MLISVGFQQSEPAPDPSRHESSGTTTGHMTRGRDPTSGWNLQAKPSSGVLHPTHLLVRRSCSLEKVESQFSGSDPINQ